MTLASERPQMDHVGPPAFDLLPPIPTEERIENGTVYTHDPNFGRASMLERVKEGTLNAGAVVATAADAPFVLESILVATAFGTANTTHSPAATALSATAAALLVTAGSSWGAPRVFSRGLAERFLIRPLNRSLGRLGLHGRLNTGPVMDTAVTYVLGVPAMTLMKQAVDPTRPERESRQYGRRLGAIAAGVGLPVNYAIATGALRPNLLTVTAAVAAGVGFYFSKKLVSKYIERKAQQDGGAHGVDEQIDMQAAPEIETRYHLPKEEFESIQAEMVAKVKEEHGENTVSAVVMGPESPYADLVRTLEVMPERWPEMEEIMKSYETNCQYVALVDTRDGADRIVHAFRLSNLALGEKDELGPDASLQAALLQDLVNSGQISDEDLREHYRERGVDLSRSVSVESNFIVGDRTPAFNGLKTSDLGYLTIFTLAAKAMGDHNASIFAHLNKPAKISLGRAGVQYRNVADRENLKTPTTGGKMDANFQPVEIPATEHNVQLFKDLQPFALPLTRL